MVLSRSSVFLEVIEILSKSPLISNGDVEEISKDISHKGAHLLKIPRVNVWLLNTDANGLDCLVAYERENERFYREPSLKKEECPLYFAHIIKQNIIVSSDAQSEIHNIEILRDYLIPNNIFSMMEIPILSGGKFQGIICFESNQQNHDWNHDEQHFAIALTQLLALTLEIEKKKSYREQLEEALREKSTLIEEINHRVKNNLSMLTALIRREAAQSKDSFHTDLFANILTKTLALSALHDSGLNAENINEVDFSAFIRRIYHHISDTYGNTKQVGVELNLDEVYISTTYAIPLALIINELIVNAFKHAFQSGRVNHLHLLLTRNEENTVYIAITDNGRGIPTGFTKKTSGFDLISDLCDQIDAKMSSHSSMKGTKIEIFLPF